MKKIKGKGSTLESFLKEERILQEVKAKKLQTVIFLPINNVVLTVVKQNHKIVINKQ